MFGLTPSIAAAAFVRIAPMHRCIGLSRAARATSATIAARAHDRRAAEGGRRRAPTARPSQRLGLRMVLPSPSTISAARGGPHGPMRAQ